MSRIITGAAAALTLVGASAAAAQPIETYTARLSGRDHYSSRGQALTSVAAIIRQDRANYHQFGYRDRDDTGDRFFADANNRARLEALLNAGTVTAEARRRILNDDPLIRVSIYENRIEVELLNPSVKDRP